MCSFLIVSSGIINNIRHLEYHMVQLYTQERLNLVEVEVKWHMNSRDDVGGEHLFSNQQATEYGLIIFIQHREHYVDQENMFQSGLPHFSVGPIVKGFGRGSKELKIPTANYADELVQNLPQDLTTGVYCGWASVDKGEVHKMVLNIGWNPFYQNTRKSMEIHIMHDFKRDFYGSELKLVMLTFLRPEKNFSSVDELIAAIRDDISAAEKILDQPVYAAYKSDRFFTDDMDQELEESEENDSKVKEESSCAGGCTII